MKSWIDALKDFNKGSEMWSIPRQGTSNHAFVMRIMKGMTTVPDKVVLLEQKTRRPRSTLNISL